MDTLSLLAGTVMLRPYVFAFLALFLFLASRQIGWPRTVLWTLTGYGLAWLAEFGSIHWGVPFGDYFYIETTRDRELWVGGVPFMDSLSFAFLTYTGYACAVQLAAALRRRDAGRPRTPEGPSRRFARSPAFPILVGAGVTTLMDVVIDPVTLMGDRWFLGLLYRYRHHGVYFGVPLSNFAGWFLLSAAIIGVNRAAAPLFGDRAAPATRIPYLHLGGFVLFALVVAFNLAVTAWLGEYPLLFVGTVWIGAFLALSARTLHAGGMLAPSPPRWDRGVRAGTSPHPTRAD